VIRPNDKRTTVFVEDCSPQYNRIRQSYQPAAGRKWRGVAKMAIYLAPCGVGVHSRDSTVEPNESWPMSPSRKTEVLYTKISEHEKKQLLAVVLLRLIVLAAGSIG
jgi:hypothetical protein